MVIYAMQKFEECAKENIMRSATTIENVAFADTIKLFSLIPAPKRLFLPGEIGNENITILVTPAPGFTICIESEPCLKFVPKINLINYN